MALSVANAVMNEVQTILLDPNGNYWTVPYLISAYNIVVTAIIGENPTALTKVIPNFALVTGVDQTIPSDQQPYGSLTDGVMFLRAPANTNGKVIRQVAADVIQEDDPDWYSAAPSQSVQNVILDDFDPLRFRVYPPNDGTGQINLQYAFAPLDITSLTQDFTLTEAYRVDVRNGLLGMAYALNTDRQDLPKAQFYLSQMDKNVASKIQVLANTAQKIKTTTSSE